MNIFKSSSFVSRSLIRAVGLSASAMALLASGNAAQAQVNIGDGYDLFTTSSQFESFFRTEVPGGGIVEIPLMANPFIPGTNIDTKVRRTGECTLFAGDSCVQQIQMAGLSLKSSAPVTIGGEEFDVDIVSGDLLGKPANPIVDALITLNQQETGGEISVSVLPFDVMVTFNPLGGGQSIMIQDTIVFDQGWTNVWSTQPGPMDPHTGNMPAGGLYVGIDPVTGQKAMSAPHITPGEAHYIDPAMTVPEPSATVALALFGLAGIWGLKKK